MEINFDECKSDEHPWNPATKPTKVIPFEPFTR